LRECGRGRAAYTSETSDKKQSHAGQRCGRMMRCTRRRREVHRSLTKVLSISDGTA
jgi:hypothetical protein